MQNDPSAGFSFCITDIQTVLFPLPSHCWTLDRNRRFFVSVTDGIITKNSRAALLDQPLRWSESLDGFIVEPSSQITLKVFEKHHVRKNNLLATFVIPYDVLRFSQNAIVQSIDDSKEKKTPSREINVTWSERLIISVEPDSHNVEEMRSGLEAVKSDTLKMNNPALAVGIAGVADHVGQGLDIAGKAVPSVQAVYELVTERLGLVVRAVDAIAEVHPYAKIAWSVISFIPTKISEQIQLDKDILDLFNEIELALDLSPDEDTLRSRCRDSDRCKKTLTRLLEQISECGHFIQLYVKDVNFGKRLLRNLVSDGKSVVENFRLVLRKLRDDFISDTIVAVESNVFRILAEVESISENVRSVGKDVKEVKENVKEVDLNVKLQKLPYGQGTDFDPGRGCLPQTRVKILDEIITWVNDPSSPQVLLLFGQAGTGKSSIAHEIAHRFRSMDRLTTSYCFVRGKPSSRDCYRFFTTLTHNLCNKYPAFRVALTKVINSNPGLVEMQAYTPLFESLLRDPLKDICFVGPVFIVIDALDESEDASETQRWDTLVLHDFLATRLAELPCNFRILITSRPEQDIEKAFSEASFVRRMYMNDSKLRTGLDGDMDTYMRSKLRKAKGVTENDLEKLVKKAEGNFQWAFVACSHISRPPSGLDSRCCIERLLELPTAVNSKMALNPLDELYTTILKRFNMKDRVVRSNFKSVMGQILGAREPLSVAALDKFAPSNDGRANVSAIVEDLGSLLSHVTPPESALPVAPLHTSFRDFLICKTRSGAFYIDLDNVHIEFVLATLRTMQVELKFNICKLETSYLLNSEVSDLKRRVEDNIPSALSYSCRFWAYHLTRVSKFNSDAFKSLRVFMKQQFLFWLEVLSVRGEVAVAKPALLSLQGWLNKMHDKIVIEEMDEVKIEKIDGFVNDAIAFVRYFGYPIAQSAPHIYLSALPFSPASSVISKVCIPRFSTLRLEKGGLTMWLALEMTIHAGEDMRCIAWSRDGEYIAAGGFWSVYVWSTSTGMLAREPFRVGVCVASIAFSHDGQHLVFGLWNEDIQIWDLMKGTKTQVRGPWTRAYSYYINVSAVAFSEDGKQLVVGLGDGRIWVWDLEKAEVVGEPFVGHNNPIWALSFLDQEHIVSRSGFRTVQVWNVKTRERVTRMDVPTGTIDSAVHYTEFFYRDNTRVKSSFEVCSWTEAAEGEEKYAIEGHWPGWSPAAAFSLDGKLVATCSDTHVRVCFAKGSMAGSLAGGPFSNERGTCLAISADGQRIASGTKNGTLRVWNVQVVDEDGTELINRRNPYSVAFTPDGEQIVVGWEDGRVAVLDASTGQEVEGIKEGDANYDRPLVAVSANGDRIASTKALEMYIWTRTGKAVAGPLTSANDQGFSPVAFSPVSNDLVAHGTVYGNVCVLNTSTGALIAGPKKFSDYVTALALAPSITNGSTTMKPCVAVGAGHQMFIWDTLTGSVAGPFMHHSKHYIYALVFSSDGKYVTSAAGDYTLCVWDSLDGKAVRGPVTFRNRQTAISNDQSVHVALTRDGRRVAFMGVNNTILLFDVVYKGDSDVALHSLVVLAGHLGSLNFFAFSQDGQFLATPSNDGTVRIWDLQAILEHKRALDTDYSDVFNLDETWIDHDGWAVCANGDGGASPLRRMIWFPEIHRDGLYHSSSVCVVGGQSKETRLNLKNFVHGKNWAKCWPVSGALETFHDVFH